MSVTYGRGVCSTRVTSKREVFRSSQCGNSKESVKPIVGYQQNSPRHHRTNLVHQCPLYPSLRCLELTHIVPVPNRISLPSPLSSSPSSMSVTRGFLATGKRGNGRRVIKDGNTVSKDRYSGLDRSGAVHVRMCTSDSSMSSSDRKGGNSIGTSPSSSTCSLKITGGARSSFPEGRWGVVVLDDWVDAECDKGGMSRNGSLGARVRFVSVLIAVGVADTLMPEGEYWDRKACADGD